MEKQPPPSYEQSQGMPNPQYNPTFPNTGQIGFQVPSNPSAPYPGAGEAYPNAGQPYPYPSAGAPYPAGAQHYPTQAPINAQPYPMEMQTSAVYVAGVQGGMAPVPVVITQQLGPRSTTIFCPTCKENVTTKTNTEPGTLAWLSCAAIALLGCWFGCCLIPFCMDACQDVYHKCPRCNTFFGKYSRCN